MDTNALTARQILAVILTGYNAKIETIETGVFHIHTSPGQLEAVREAVNAGLPGVQNVLAYNDTTLGVFVGR